MMLREVCTARRICTCCYDSGNDKTEICPFDNDTVGCVTDSFLDALDIIAKMDEGGRKSTTESTDIKECARKIKEYCAERAFGKCKSCALYNDGCFVGHAYKDELTDSYGVEAPFRLGLRLRRFFL